MAYADRLGNCLITGASREALRVPVHGRLPAKATGRHSLVRELYRTDEPLSWHSNHWASQTTGRIYPSHNKVTDLLIQDVTSFRVSKGASFSS